MKHYFYLHWLSAKTALGKLLRQPLASLLSLLMLSIALALPISLYLTVTSLQDWIGRLTATPQVTLFMEMSAEEADLAAVNGSLKGHPKVESYQYVNRTQALAELENRHGLAGVAEGLDGNPLPDAFVVTPATLEPGDLERLQKELSGLPMVEEAQYDAHWAKRLYGLMELGKHLTVALAVAFAVALVLVTHNTIRMQILARRDEIEVATLIGATESFIRRPFLYHAFWQGLLAALIAWGLSALYVANANPAIVELARLYNERVELRGLAPLELAALIAGAILLAALGARLAASHHLRRLAPR
ncbi:permease-like cell division protein FtsX [Crenobacter cavernae]|uniref:Cell division protein FtsX n=1 Tax=Crenobacter cavernae TaxID=2290923 RepID=A0A345Y3T8_9NEIS|nr:permease-like cell division protein FtsX [Crenobacter cavernae]AXK38590.1 ABC transporter permease [Crenobacter cavernae]